MKKIMTFLIDIITTQLAKYVTKQVKGFINKRKIDKSIEKLEEAKDEKDYEDSAKNMADLIP